MGQFSPIEGQVSFINFSDDYVMYAPDNYLHVFYKDLTNTLFFKLYIDNTRRGQTMAKQYGDEMWLVCYHSDGEIYKGSGSINVIDIADPSNIHYNYTYRVGGEYPTERRLLGEYERRGDVLYMINQTQGFCTLDVSEMGNFQMMDQIDFAPRKGWETVVRPRNVELYDHYAFVSDLGGGRVIDISDPYNLREVARLDVPGTLSFFFLYGSDLYVTSDAAGGRMVTVFDISNPLSPVQEWSLSQPDPDLCTHAIARLGKYMFMLESQKYPWTYSTGIKVFDVSDTDNPVLVDFYDTSSMGPLFGDLGSNIGIDNNLLYVGQWNRASQTNSRMMICDVSEYAIPEPSTALMIIPALAGLAGVIRMRRGSHKK